MGKECYLQQPCCRCCCVRARLGLEKDWPERKTTTTTTTDGRTDEAGRALLVVVPPPTTSGPPPPPPCAAPPYAAGGRLAGGRRRRRRGRCGTTTMDVQGRAAVGVCRGDAFMLGLWLRTQLGGEELSTTTEQHPLIRGAPNRPTGRRSSQPASHARRGRPHS
jgi:hypothetical protein